MRKPVLTAAALGCAWASPAPAAIVPSIARVMRIPRRISDVDGVAMTFDDGPHPEGTVAVMEELLRVKARATFFLVGEQVERNPSLASEIVAAGHSVAVHGYRHRNQLLLTPKQFAADLKRAVATISDSTGVRPEVYRPPYGVFSIGGLGIVRRSGLRSLLWSRWGHDWRARTTPAAIAAEISSGLRGGDVLLLHDADHYSASGSWKHTAAALPEILAAIEGGGLRAIPI